MTHRHNQEYGNDQMEESMGAEQRWAKMSRNRDIYNSVKNKNKHNIGNQDPKMN